MVKYKAISVHCIPPKCIKYHDQFSESNQSEPTKIVWEKITLDQHKQCQGAEHKFAMIVFKDLLSKSLH